MGRREGRGERAWQQVLGRIGESRARPVPAVWRDPEQCGAAEAGSPMRDDATQGVKGHGP